MTRVLVAGATGYLGRHAVVEFSRRGYSVRALSRPESTEKLSHTGQFREPPVCESVDDLFVGTVTDPQTLTGLCDGIDIVFSSLGVTRQQASPWAVDYEANRTILDLAIESDVEQFVFVSVYMPSLWGKLIEPRERFVEKLHASEIEHTVVRPTGYYSDMTEFFEMARRGRVFLVGDGNARINPVHGADLAKACVDAIDDARTEFAVGGPEVFTYNEIANLAFRTLDESASVTYLPKWFVDGLLTILRPFDNRTAAFAEAVSDILTTDVVAPKAGTHSLSELYSELAQRTGSR
ncbi:SDR family oxidoreductase (plasmid) [Haloferax sp. S1W]|uniref:SDR family oxidoreductase n=1 Tax=Haloferax sp. S1W TaxID=3377110 RepID=UPI0037C7781B